jgi:hypothetical protein
MLQSDRMLRSHSDNAKIDRRTLCRVLAIGASALTLQAEVRTRADLVNLFTAPMDLGGDWQGSLPSSALAVVTRMREACLSGIQLVSDRQPEKIHIDDRTAGPPSIWLHYDKTRVAWILVDVEERDWCKLAYQFGHELGHVLANSWESTSAPKPPSQWLEESIVEAFSIRGLGRLAESWKVNPPFTDDSAFSVAIAQYRQHVINNYEKAEAPHADLAEWFQKSRSRLESPGTALDTLEGPAIVEIERLLDGDDGCVADIGAVNRWPARTGVPVERYLSLWQASCAEVGAPGRLPQQLRTLFRVGEDGG